MNSPEHDAAPPIRRNFLTEALAVLFGALSGIVPGAAGVAYYLSPAARKSSDGGTDMIPVASVSDLPTDGQPVRFAVVAKEKRDAFTVYRDVPIGSVYLCSKDGGVVAFNDTCPHLGCKVDYQGDRQQFYCPCHTSAFDLEGRKTNAIPPRDLDRLDVEVRDGVAYVKYQDFQGATSAKFPVV